MLLSLILYIVCVLQLFTSEDAYEQILSFCQKGSPNCLLHWEYHLYPGKKKGSIFI